MPLISASAVGNSRTFSPPVLTALLTATAPLLAYNQPPSSTLLNQCLAVATWGGFVWALAPGAASKRGWPLQAALLALMVGVIGSWSLGALPASIALSHFAGMSAAMLVAWAGTEAARRGDAISAFAAFAWGLLAAGLLSVVVAVVQVFLPDWASGGLVAHSGLVGRAVGNLRQPNHLCSLLLWAVIAAVALCELGRLSQRQTIGAVIALVFAVELSASRTGAAALLLLAAWGVLGRSLSRPTRWLLLATPLIYAVAYGVMLGWGELMHQAVGAEARLAGAATGIESPNTRGRIWANALAMIAQQPWLGVGFGEFNLAWSLTPFPGRPTAFFDHTHNLPLQLAVELGLPLAGAVMALMLIGLGLAWQRSRRCVGPRGVAAMSAWMMVLMIGLHSLVEYPLWYLYFLLPTVFAWGYALGTPAPHAAQARRLPGAAAKAAALSADGDLGGGAQRGQPHPGLGRAAGAVMIVGAAVTLFDYLRVVAIYAPGASAASLDERIARGQRSLFFAYQGDYAAATSPEPVAGSALAFTRAPHFLMDTRLMVAWATHLAATGQVDLARHLAERIREFRNADAAQFLAVCQQSGAGAHFQCQAPQRQHNWREFLLPAAPHATPPTSAR